MREAPEKHGEPSKVGFLLLALTFSCVIWDFLSRCTGHSVPQSGWLSSRDGFLQDLSFYSYFLNSKVSVIVECYKGEQLQAPVGGKDVSGVMGEFKGWRETSSVLLMKQVLLE